MSNLEHQSVGHYEALYAMLMDNAEHSVRGMHQLYGSVLEAYFAAYWTSKWKFWTWWSYLQLAKRIEYDHWHCCNIGDAPL